MDRIRVPIAQLVSPGGSHPGFVHAGSRRVDPERGHVIGHERRGFRPHGYFPRLVVGVANSDDVERRVTVVAARGQVPLVVPVPAKSWVLIGPFESARFAQLDGLHVDAEPDFTGTIAAAEFPQ
jgi:hypothetical protein